MDANQTGRLFQLYPVLREVEPGLLEPALERCRLVSFEAGTIVFQELQPCRAFPFILEGRIRVFKQSVNGRELSLYNVAPGDACVVTAGCLLGDEPYNAMGLVKEAATLVMMAAEDFETLLKARVFREFIFSLFSSRVLGLMQLVEEVAFQKLDARLAALLLKRGKSIHVSHQELADELGTVREMITRLLNGFADSGLIKPGRGRLEIIDPAALRLIAEP